MLKDRDDAYRLLEKLGASRRLLVHVRLVGEAADKLIALYAGLGIRCNEQLIQLGAAVHDAGKILHPEELDRSGSVHEQAGEALLTTHGVQPDIARFCISHARWREPHVSFEELSVALADKLWKGKREPELETKVIDEAASRKGVGRWDVFVEMDAGFEEIAAGGADRLRRSKVV